MLATGSAGWNGRTTTASSDEVRQLREQIALHQSNIDLIVAEHKDTCNVVNKSAELKQQELSVVRLNLDEMRGIAVELFKASPQESEIAAGLTRTFEAGERFTGEQLAFALNQPGLQSSVVNRAVQDQITQMMLRTQTGGVFEGHNKQRAAK